jgi:hypothetical protein
MNKLTKRLKGQKLFTKNVILLSVAVLAALVIIAVINPADIRTNTLDSLGLSGGKPDRNGQLNSTAPLKTVTTDENSDTSTITVTNPKFKDDDGQPISNGDGNGSDSDDNSSSSPSGCVWHEYTGSELISDVKAQIGQLVSYEDKTSYVSAVEYSEQADGQKDSIKYYFENGDSRIPESAIQSVSGVPGYYVVDDAPIKVSEKPDSCPAP